MARLSKAAAAALVSVHFLALAGDGLRSGFMPDDMMNLYGYWTKPAWRLAADLLNPFAASYRPAGALFYAPLFALFGLEPRAFRMVCFLLLVTNLGLAFLLIRRLTQSFTAAILGALLFSYQAHLSDLYYSSATIYDLLAGFFYYGCLLLYVQARQQNRPIGGRRCLALSALFWLALNSKEIAVTLPAILLAWEISWAGFSARQSNLPSRLAGSWRCVACMTILGIVYLAPRLSGPAAMTSNLAYQPVWSVQTYLENLSHYLSLLLYRPQRLSAPATLALCAATLAAAVLARSRTLTFAWLLFIAGSLPVMFIPPRGAFVTYVPALGLALYLAQPAARAATTLAQKARGLGMSERATALAGPAALAVLALLLHSVHQAHKPLAAGWVAKEERKLRQVFEAASRSRSPLPPGARVLLRGDPFAEDDWAPVLALRLYYRDPNLRVERVPDPSPLPQGAAGAYDAVFVIR
jgi:hypothetical protein